jgi:hypothetical protein
MIALTSAALNAATFDQCRCQTFDGIPIAQQRRQRSINEALLIVSPESAEIGQHALSPRQVFIKMAVLMRV